MKISVVKNILEANDRIAEQNRGLFDEHSLTVMNLMSSPGAGKTSLLERTIQALKEDLAALDLLVVENVGNLVCPAEFKVGEDFKAMILSVTEGDDKPAKYPLMFHESSVLLINKIDLLPYVDCTVERIREEALKINPHMTIFEISCKTGDGLEAWYEWLKQQVRSRKKA
ncbi:MAG: hydrogenase accessory protein HypB [Desulfobacteraceae bacterium 4484_190.3]|nr:MAG: hydrogenase accessory protein HypB [Desulfobacteraceae bacterium 4484_190.3]